jgi:hypothetical protein
MEDTIMQYPKVNYSGIFANMGQNFQQGMTQFDKSLEYGKEKLKEEEAVAKLKEMEKDFTGMKKTVADEIAGTMMGQPDKTIDGVKKQIMSIKTPQELYAKANEYRLQLQDFEQNKDVYKIKPLFGIKSTTYANQNQQFVDAAKQQGIEQKATAEEATAEQERRAVPGQVMSALEGKAPTLDPEGLPEGEIPPAKDPLELGSRLQERGVDVKDPIAQLAIRGFPKEEKPLTPEDIEEQEHKKWKRGEEKRKASFQRREKVTKEHRKKERPSAEFFKIKKMITDAEKELREITVSPEPTQEEGAGARFEKIKGQKRSRRQIQDDIDTFNNALNIMKKDKFIRVEEAIDRAEGEVTQDVDRLLELHPDKTAKIPGESAQSVYRRLGVVNVDDPKVVAAIKAGWSLDEIAEEFEKGFGKPVARK